MATATPKHVSLSIQGDRVALCLIDTMEDNQDRPCYEFELVWVAKQRKQAPDVPDNAWYSVLDFLVDTGEITRSSGNSRVDRGSEFRLV